MITTVGHVKEFLKDTDQADHKAEYVNKTIELVTTILSQEIAAVHRIAKETRQIPTDKRKLFQKVVMDKATDKPVLVILIRCDHLMNTTLIKSAQTKFEELQQDSITKVCCNYLIKEAARSFENDHRFDLYEIEDIKDVQNSALIKAAAVKVIMQLSESVAGTTLMGMWAKSFT